MKKVILILALISGISLTGHAQSLLSKLNPEEKVKQLKDKLGLSTDQVSKIIVIYRNQNRKIDSLKKVGADDSKVQEEKKSTDDKIIAELTPEQAIVYKKMSGIKDSKMLKNIGF